MDVAAARAGEPAIRLEVDGREFRARDVALTGNVRVQQGLARDGAVVWVEADGYVRLD